MHIWLKSATVALAFVLSAAAPLTAHAAQPPAASGDPTSRYQEYVEQQAELSGAPGVAWAVVGPDGIEQQGTVGVDGNGAGVTGQTPFLWGSVSKPVTATLVVRLDSAGALDLDAPVVDYLPDFATADPDSSARITVRQLLDHTSGLPEGLELIDQGGERSFGEVIDAMAGLQPLAQPGEEYQYSGLNYIVLGAVVEQVTGTSFADALAEQLFTPAGMTTMRADAADAEQALPPGHRYVAGRAVGFGTEIDPAAVPAGYLVGSLEDAAAFARINLGGPVLSDQERTELHSAQVSTGPDSSYGLGWRQWQVPGSDAPMVWHGGAVPGYSSAVLLLPEQDRAVVVLQNAYGPFQEEQLLGTAWGLAALVTGGEPVDHPVDPTYLGLLAGLAVVVLVLLVLIGRQLVGLRRPGRRRPVVRVVIGVLLVAVLAGLLYLPTLFGVGLAQLPLWAPDIAGLLYAGLGLATVALLLLVAGWFASRRRGGVAQPT